MRLASLVSTEIEPARLNAQWFCDAAPLSKEERLTKVDLEFLFQDLHKEPKIVTLRAH